MKTTKKNGEEYLFPGFNHSPNELSAFHLSLNSFVLSLKNGKLIRFAPEDTEAFLHWLKKNRIKDIR